MDACTVDSREAGFRARAMFAIKEDDRSLLLLAKGGSLCRICTRTEAMCQIKTGVHTKIKVGIKSKVRHKSRAKTSTETKTRAKTKTKTPIRGIGCMAVDAAWI